MTYTLIVGTKEWSSWSLRPYVALRHIGVAFKEEVVPLRRHTSSAEVQKRSRSGRVPVLEIEEKGERYHVWDSLAICETLADRHPEAKLLPDDPKLRALARAYSAEMHSGFPDVREQLTMEFVREIPTPDLRDATRAQIERIKSAWSDALGEYGKDGGFLFGRFSIADCMYAPVVSRFRTYGIALSAPLKAYCDRIWALPAMKDWGKAAKAEVDAGLA
ncbi:MAG TPA: glutathione S-transferase [Rhizomicrobium sp.]|nr:glutathione S-transferase [Rhizomicrobium sp.]